MFAIPEVDAAANCAIPDEERELSAAMEMRLRFPGIIDTVNSQA